jgi:hypothetical protein
MSVLGRITLAMAMKAKIWRKRTNERIVMLVFVFANSQGKLSGSQECWLGTTLHL